MESTGIQHVSDTAIWVAYYRALESERADALFSDPYAKRLVGERGQKIARHMKATAKYTAWSLVIRTRIIDGFIKKLIAEGVDTVINLGAGLDSRPYRMDLPSNLHWVEVDYPHLIDYKTRILQSETPHCRLERVQLDLAHRDERRKLLAKLAAHSRQAIILTEGVLPYLSETQVAELADDLREHPSFRFWIAEYFAADVYRYLRDPRRMKKMKNAPFRFFPADWFGFFKNHGWLARDIRYLAEESIQLKRKVPAPWWTFIFKPFAHTEGAKKYQRFTGYVVYTQDQAQ